MNLLYSSCVPILTYGAETVEFSNSDMRDCNTAGPRDNGLEGTEYFLPLKRGTVIMKFENLCFIIKI